MSGPDKADQDKSFLARWSQRKQEAKQPEPKPDAPVAPAPEIPSGPVAEVEAEPEAEPEFDLSSLPTLEELTESTDITAFLKKGVPEHLRNAALRKSWALDPAIRNYVNPALEYAYDWNKPGGVPGGGELDAGVDVARLVSQIMGDPVAEIANPNENSENAAADSDPQPFERDLSAKTQQDLPVQSVNRVGQPAVETKKGSSTGESGSEEAAPVVESQLTSSAAPQQPVRRHGTAKPIV